MVEWKKLGEVSGRNKGIPITAGQMSELASKDGNVRVFAAGSTIADIDESLLPKNCAHKLPSIIVKSRGYIDFEFYEKPFTHKNEMWSYSFDNKQEGKFIYYFLTTQTDFFRNKAKANSVKLPQLCVADTDNYLIPIPSLEEQARIVGILDTFTSAIDNLKEQIAQRRKQYEYYRDQLLDLEGKEVIETLSFGNDFQLKARIGWQGLTKKEYKSSGDYKLVTGTDFTGNLRIDFASCVFVEKERYEQDEYIKLKVGDVLITKDGTLGKVAYIDQLDMPATLNGGVFVVRDPKRKVLPKFIMYYLTSYHFKKWMQQNHTTGSIQHLTQKLLSSFTIPVLPEAEQQRIVSILDTFEASIQNLEAQLKEREKQYEYYRNKLLTFE